MERSILVIGQPVVQGGEAGLIQHGGTYELVVEVLIDVANAAGELSDGFLRGRLAVNEDLTFEVAGIIMWDQPVQQLAQR
ncbi:hypothetical protein D3C81_1981010 [compost metagenome]